MVEIRQVILARTLQQIKSVSGTAGYLPDIVNQIAARYGFLKIPKTEELIPTDPPKGAEFLHGKVVSLDRTIIIDRLTLFSEIVVADTVSTTDDNDLIFDDLAQWASTALPKLMISGPRFYLSHIEMKMNAALQAYAPAFAAVGEQITAKLASYGIQAPKYEATALNLYYDTLGKAAPQPGVFYIDRRKEIPYSENIWFSQAPLRTRDHIALLKELEP